MWFPREITSLGERGSKLVKVIIVNGEWSNIGQVLKARAALRDGGRCVLSPKSLSDRTNWDVTASNWWVDPSTNISLSHTAPGSTSAVFCYTYFFKVKSSRSFFRNIYFNMIYPLLFWTNWTNWFVFIEPISVHCNCFDLLHWLHNIYG